MLIPSFPALRLPRGRACRGLIRESALAATPEVKSKDPEYLGMFIPGNQLFHWMSPGKPGLRSVPGGKQLSLIFHIIFLFFFSIFLFFPCSRSLAGERQDIFPSPVFACSSNHRIQSLGRCFYGLITGTLESWELQSVQR